ncbi:MAG: hypothetical protein Q7R76_05545 [Candidatus Woesearchaeota archaeon]|nr:hypothetical protein [Candidatus Woesearchaeota archaeon]
MNKQQATLITLLALTTPAVHAASSVKASAEAFAHSEGIKRDIKARVTLDDVPLKPWYFLRDKPATDYNGKTIGKRLTINEVMLGLPYDVRLGGQARFVGEDIFPVAAAERYSQLTDTFALYAAARVGFGNVQIGELHLTPKFKMDDISLSVETVTQTTSNKFLGTKVAARLGYQLVDGFIAGIGVDTALGTGKPADYQAGLFVMIGK